MQGNHKHEIPKEYQCPINQEIMQDPVVAADGFTYEREAIEQWLASGGTTSPMTGQALEHTILVPNTTLRNLIRAFQNGDGAVQVPDKHPEENDGSIDLDLALRLYTQDLQDLGTCSIPQIDNVQRINEEVTRSLRHVSEMLGDMLLQADQRENESRSKMSTRRNGCTIC